jgi:hypothetical protein
VGQAVLVQPAVGDQAVDAAPLVLHLPHDLAERAVELPDQVLPRHPDLVEEDLAEVAVARGVDDAVDGDPRGVHGHHQVGQSLVGLGVRVGAADQVAPVGVGRAGGPDLLARHHELVTVGSRGRADAGDVGPGVGLAHADAPHRRAGDDAGQPSLALGVGPVLEQRRAHLPIGEPRGGDRRTRADQGLEHHEPLQGRPPAPAVLHRPGHAQPTPLAQLLGEGPVVADDPAVVGRLGPVGRRQPNLSGLGLQVLQLGRQHEVHGR